MGNAQCCLNEPQKRQDGSQPTRVDNAEKRFEFSETAVDDIQVQNFAGGATPLVKVKGSQKRDEGTMAHARKITVLVQKTSLEEKLGIDVKHAKGRLVVVDIFPGGAAYRVNWEQRQKTPPGEVIEVGDVIIDVNGIQNLDTAMVIECRQKLTLNIVVLRV
eukprot:TRINITY_DN33335_c0_g1_i1.p1 TRINITY_DN33335_c0_g1~~TRINITY_DN33335_c0_g1_i1.p1  ORF type:complete len:161 (+),score=28.30 TRINITY_DN33335_c0_g1_i1:186-668(+)